MDCVVHAVANSETQLRDFHSLTHTVKSFGMVNKAEVDVFLELSCYFHDSTDETDLKLSHIF